MFGIGCSRPDTPTLGRFANWGIPRQFAKRLFPTLLFNLDSQPFNFLVQRGKRNVEPF